MKNLLFLLMFPVLCFGQTAEEYEKSGRKKLNLKDYKGAIADYTKACELGNCENYNKGCK